MKEKKSSLFITLFFLGILLLFALCVRCGNVYEQAGGEQETIEDQQDDKEQSTTETQPKESDYETEEPTTEESTLEETLSEGSTHQTEDLAGETNGTDENGDVDKIHVEGTRLVDGNGKDVQLKGISTHGIAWYPEYINEACFEQLKQEWNVNVIRLAMYTAESGGYCSGGDKDALKELVQNGVEYATNQGLYVIIDWHILSDSNPNTNLEEAKLFFDEMSRKYADYDNVLYEICNEPNGGTTWQTIKSYAEEVIPVIRNNAADAVILVGTPNWSQYVDQAAADPITKYDNIMYTLHFYAATHKEDLRNRMISAVEAGLPVFVSEYGICDASGNGGIDEAQANKWVEVMNRYGISYVAWNLSNKNETSAILKSSCKKTNGFTSEDLSASGKWLYEMLTGNKASSAATENGNHTENGNRTESRNPADNKNDSETGNAANPSNGNPDQSAVNTLHSGDFEIDVTLADSWEENGNKVYRYTLTLTNKTQKACSQWMIEIPFRDSFTLKDSWNGEYSVQDKILRISSKDYNGNIPVGGSVSDIGFIIMGGNGIQ